MMRRGGRIVQAPRGGDDGAIPSVLDLDKGLKARNCVKVIVLAACSIAIVVMIWSLREPSGALREPHNLRSRNAGFVFPLYRSYHAFPNGSRVVGSRVVGGRGRWRGRRAGFHGRGILSEEAKPLFEIHGGHRIDDRLLEELYIELKLGSPPKPFRFHIDTGSGPLSWVFCNDLGRFGSFIEDSGPNGLFVPSGNSYVKCIGATASICLVLQELDEECDKKHNYNCLFTIGYFDGSTYSGHVVNGSITLRMLDGTERMVFALFGCTFEKGGTDMPVTLTDGVIGLGNCAGSLVDQLSTSNAISRKVLGVCLGKGMLPDDSVGYISLGMDFENFNEHSSSVSNWVELLDQSRRGVCSYAAKLLYIFVDQKKITIRRTDKTAAFAIYFDSGSELTYLHKNVYDQVLKALDTYATNRAYVRKEDNEYIEASEQRVCWEPPAKKRKTRGKSMGPKASPYHDFGPLKLGFEGLASDQESATVEYMIIQPENYLIWDEDEIKLCVNILRDTSRYGLSNLGADIMREHLFVFDVENNRVRWKATSNCDISSLYTNMH